MPFVVATPLQPSELPCASCKVLYGSTCCETDRGPDGRFPMTYAEAKRIAGHERLPFDEAVDVREVSVVDSEKLRISTSVSISDLIVAGRGLYLPLVGRQCKYLGPHGCTIPSVKPTLCALFPFWNQHGVWTLGVLAPFSGFCLGKDLAAGDTTKAMKLFGVSPFTLEEVYRRWQRDRKTHAVRLRSMPWRKSR